MNDTPLTITISAWNYCQNSCHYCVSGSNLPEWKFGGNFEIFAPPDCGHLSDLDIRKLHGNGYYERMCPDKKRYLNKKNVMDFCALRKWLLVQADDGKIDLTKTAIHVSGGEPLLRPDIESQIQVIVDIGVRVTVFTNGLLIEQRPRLLDMPLNWVVAHHWPNPLHQWRRNAILVAKKPHYACRVIESDRTRRNMQKLTRDYDGLNFHWVTAGGGRLMPTPAHTDRHIASRVLHLVLPDGRVYPCNIHAKTPIGHIHTLIYDVRLAYAQDSRADQCAASGSCPAYQTAILCSEL